MIQVNRIYLIFNRLVTKKFLVDTSDLKTKIQYFTKGGGECLKHYVTPNVLIGFADMLKKTL